MRFTSANEHGDASNGGGYTDRQHTSDDILGVDTDSDMIIDSFFVNFNYLARNAVINGVGASMIAIGPETPDFNYSTTTSPSLTISITDQTQYDQYRDAIRTTSNDWDSVYTINSTYETINILPTASWYYISVASVDSVGIESLFSYEVKFHFGQLEILEPLIENTGYSLLQNYPNPFDESTYITVYVTDPSAYKEASIVIRDLSGKIIDTIPMTLDQEMNEVEYQHGYGATGLYTYTLVIDGIEKETKTMVFAN